MALASLGFVLLVITAVLSGISIVVSIISAIIKLDLNESPTWKHLVWFLASVIFWLSFGGLHG